MGSSQRPAARVVCLDRYVKTEPFFLATFDETRPWVVPAALTEEELGVYRGHTRAEEMPYGVEPPELADVVAALRTAPPG
ncbi:hypothetical protein [Nonomuraea sp. NPDC052265]|uniref:hypothetical protein n=1 Tax=Nonomuraea sp. NPDC052265 TaxID=3364374 RepID=UPI0037CBD11C